MSKFSKYDVVDIVFVCLGVKLVLSALEEIVFMPVLFFSDHTPDVHPGFSVATGSVAAAGLGVLGCLFLFKRRFLINLLFPGSADTQVEVSDGLVLLTRYAFWIRLIGLVMFFRFVIWLLRGLTWNLTTLGLSNLKEFLSSSTWMELTSTIAALVIIWKAEWLAAKLERFAR